jgi:hypothetical protein
VTDDRIFDDFPGDFADEPRRSQVLRTVDATDLLSQSYEPPRFWAEHIGPEPSIVLLLGDTGSAKTALLLHMAVALAAGVPIAGKFAVAQDAVVLYVNGEMGREAIVRYLQEAAGGLSVAVPRSRLFFEGDDGVATWRFMENPAALEQLVADLRPTVVILDTQRALLVEDEVDTPGVRRAFGWLRTHIVNAYGASVLVAHHLRKIGPVSNSARERVAGSRDILASVDVHIAAKARDGCALHALKLDKTRTPFQGVCAGAEWPVEARLEMGAPNRSIFIAGDVTSAATAADSSADDKAADEIRARLEVDGALTIDDLKANGGAAKRAMERLRKIGEVVPAGKRDRKTLYALKASLQQTEELF